MMNAWKLALVVVFVASGSLAADAFRTKDGMRAETDPSRQGVFEVFKKSGAGPSEYWCAAGDYALRKLRVPVASRLYVVRGPGPSNITSGRTSVIFTYVETPEILQAAQSAQGNSASVTKVGYNMRAAQGQSYCGAKKRDRD